ncbi:hypothetical protein [Chitinimonas sp. BJB300]|uniref:hypothetical protein n=1 Tax=Chitinimonas sp. BJB300 TaxID=1559339 RepID=UPI000C114173|nr:hypothetical protein [Chitinimonas sp. BJB300]PHV12217.1 hypothetical protein CSQ89_06725 [Chitinimonas sp. BJB300]TSJ85192.1 hypothetical protein FG002_017995 [Chitinimonas sp. BJB300]
MIHYCLNAVALSLIAANAWAIAPKLQVDPVIQSQRDTLRREILQNEIIEEQKLAERARAAMEEAIAAGDAAAARQLQNNARLHLKNIDEITREIGLTKATTQTKAMDSLFHKPQLTPTPTLQQLGVPTWVNFPQE